MGPLGQRRKRRVVESSEEDDSDLDHEPSKQFKVDAETTTLTTRTRPKVTSRARSSTPARANTPVSTTTNGDKRNTKRAKNKSIYSFFNAATQAQRDDGSRASSLVSSFPDDEDLIDDFPDDDDVLKIVDSTPTETAITDDRKSNGNVVQLPLQSSKLPAASQRFMLVTKKSAPEVLPKPKPPPISPDQRTWAEKYKPENLEELAVHKKKVAELRGWLDEYVGGRDDKRLLILKGPSGTGKTTTLRLLASASHLRLIEWKNPDNVGVKEDGHISSTAQLEDFLNRSSQYGGLELSKDETERSDRPGSVTTKQKRVVLLEEFPNTFQKASTAAVAFRKSLLQYLAASSSSANTRTRSQELDGRIAPIVMIISESLVTTTSEASDSFITHRLLGQEILNHQGVSVIEFNPIAPTLLAKALDLIVLKEARASGRRRVPGPGVLKRLGEIGDIRSAIGSLQFMCVKGDDTSRWGGRVAATRKKGAVAKVLTQQEHETLECVTQREASLGIFHSVGKVMYNKRDEPTTSDPGLGIPVQPPDHLSQHARPKPLGVSVDDLIDTTGTDLQTFVAALHENYILSCESSDTLETIDACINALSIADLLYTSNSRNPSSRNNTITSYQPGSSVDILRQSEICFHSAVRGLLFALPSPVKRKKSSTRGDPYKMLYPTSSRLWKHVEEVNDLTARWTLLSMKSLSLPAVGTQAALGTVESWKYRTSGFAAPNSETAPSLGFEGETVLFPQPCTRLTHTEMLIDYLPYLARILSPTLDKSRARELARVTQFRGVGVPAVNAPEEADEEEAEVLEAMAASVSDATIEKHLDGVSDVMAGGDVDMGSLVLSDDDIEDF